MSHSVSRSRYSTSLLSLHSEIMKQHGSKDPVLGCRLWGPQEATPGLQEVGKFSWFSWGEPFWQLDREWFQVRGLARMKAWQQSWARTRQGLEEEASLIRRGQGWGVVTGNLMRCCQPCQGLPKKGTGGKKSGLRNSYSDSTGGQIAYPL